MIGWFWALGCSGEEKGTTTTEPNETGTPTTDTSPETTPTTDTAPTGVTIDTATTTTVTDTGCFAPPGLNGFEQLYADLFCLEWEACNTSTDCPTSTGGSSTGTSTCNYDPVAAEQCLCGTWDCNTDFPGFEYPEPPNACSQVCG